MSLNIKLEAFEGPLDLLLHLIDKNKINIYDIPIADITEQYIYYINHMEIKDLDIISEFLVMAATLLNIKSKMLLPKEESDDEGEEEDPRHELVMRLLEYKMFKYISEELKDKQLDAGRSFYRKPAIPEEIADYKEEVDVSDLLSNITLSKLHNIFQSLMKRQNDKIDPIRSKFGKIEKESVDLTKTIYEIQKYGLAHKTFSFRSLLAQKHTKMELIVTFLGILELIKIGRLRIEQENLFDDINIRYLAEDIIQIEEVSF